MRVGLHISFEITADPDVPAEVVRSVELASARTREIMEAYWFQAVEIASRQHPGLKITAGPLEEES